MMIAVTTGVTTAAITVATIVTTGTNGPATGVIPTVGGSGTCRPVSAGTGITIRGQTGIFRVPATGNGAGPEGQCLRRRA